MSVWYLWSPELYSCLKSDLKNCTVHVIVLTALGKDESYQLCKRLSGVVLPLLLWKEILPCVIK